MPPVSKASRSHASAVRSQRRLVEQALTNSAAEHTTNQDNDEEELNMGLHANRFWALSLDNALRHGLGYGLSRFQPSYHGYLLSEHETVRRRDLPLQEQLPGTSCCRATAVHVDGSERTLVPRQVQGEHLYRPVLHKAMDQGSLGWVGALWLDNCLQLRSTTVEDPLHRFFGNDLKDSLVQSGLWIHVVECTVLFNATTAPFGGHGNFTLRRLPLKIHYVCVCMISLPKS